MAASGTVTLNSDFTLTKSTGLPAEKSIPTRRQHTINYTDGTTDDKCDRVYERQLTLTASPTDLDLTSLTDIFGDALSFAEVVHVKIENLSTTSPLTIGGTGAITNALTSFLSNPGTLTLRPATTASPSVFVVGTGDDPAYAVGASNKVLRLDPGAATISVNVLIVGRSA